MKMLHITMSDNSVWKVPVEAVCANRARYYAEKEAPRGEDYAEYYRNEFSICMNDASEIVDWAANNMNWDEVKHVAIEVRAHPLPTPEDFQEGWVNGDKEVKDEAD
jgi:hypothetical protein